MTATTVILMIANALTAAGYGIYGNEPVYGTITVTTIGVYICIASFLWAVFRRAMITTGDPTRDIHLESSASVSAIVDMAYLFILIIQTDMAGKGVLTANQAIMVLSVTRWVE